MKFTFLAIVMVFAAALQPARSAETNSIPSALEEKLREIDHKLIVEQYEELHRQLLKGGWR